MNNQFSNKNSKRKSTKNGNTYSDRSNHAVMYFRYNYCLDHRVRQFLLGSVHYRLERDLQNKQKTTAIQCGDFMRIFDPNDWQMPLKLTAV